MATHKPRKCALDECGKKFTPVRVNNIYCTTACGNIASNKKRYARASHEKVCAREGCDNSFTTHRTNQLYCEKKCADEVTRAKARRALPLDEVLENAHNRDIERQNKNELKKITAANYRMRKYLDLLETCLTSYDPTPFAPPESQPSLIEKAEHEWVLVIGDWHTGQKTKLAETGGMYEQDVSTTREQVAKLWRAIQEIHAVESTGRTIKKLHVIGLGDFVDGDDMRPSQHRHIEDVVTVQTIQAFDILAWFLRQLMTLFPSIELDMIGGNHDRTGRNRGDAGLGELDYVDTYSWLLGEFIRRMFAGDIDEGRLKVRNWETFFGYKHIAGKRVVFEHGSSFKWGGGYGGVPWYGISALGPRYGQMLGEPDLVLLGHGHRPGLIPHGEGWICANGALPATSTYVQSSFKTVQRPQQWLITMHERLGITGFAPLYADVPGQLKPGMIWEDPEYYGQIANPRSEGAK